MLIVPRCHVVMIWDRTPEEYSDTFNVVREVKDILQEQFNPQGFNIGVNCGETAGQSVCLAI